MECPTGAGSLVCDLGSGDWQTCPSRPRIAATRTCSVDSDYSQESAGLHATTSHPGAPTLCWAQSVCILRSPLRQALLCPHMTAEQTESQTGAWLVEWGSSRVLRHCLPGSEVALTLREPACPPGSRLWVRQMERGPKDIAPHLPLGPYTLKIPSPRPSGVPSHVWGPLCGPRHLRSGQ